MKRLGILFSLFLLGIALLTPTIVSANYGKGWMRSQQFTDTTCSTWRLEVPVYNTAGSPLTVDQLNIDVNKWDALAGTWVNGIFATTQYNTNYYMSPCISDSGKTGDWFPLYISASKTGYEHLDASRVGINPPLTNLRIVRSLYVAQNSEPINIAQVFPLNNQILNYSNVAIQAYFNRRPGTNITGETIWVDLDNSVTGSRYSTSINPTGTSSTVTLPPVSLADGFYTWAPVLWDYTGSDFYIYDIPIGEHFIVDTTPPATSCNASISGSGISVQLASSDATSGVNPSTGEVAIRSNTTSTFTTQPWTTAGLPNNGNTSSNFLYAFTPGLSYQFRFRINDYAGWTSSFSYCQVTAPAATPTPIQSGPTFTPTPTAIPTPTPTPASYLQTNGDTHTNGN